MGDVWEGFMVAEAETPEAGAGYTFPSFPARVNPAAAGATPLYSGARFAQSAAP